MTRVTWGLLAGAALVVAACSEETVNIYEAPSEQGGGATTSTATGGSGGTGGDSAGAGGSGATSSTTTTTSGSGGSCQALSCGDVAHACGVVSDGCEGVIDCGEHECSGQFMECDSDGYCFCNSMATVRGLANLCFLEPDAQSWCDGHDACVPHWCDDDGTVLDAPPNCSPIAAHEPGDPVLWCCWEDGAGGSG